MTGTSRRGDDPLPVLLVLVATAVYLLRGFDAYLSMDVATYAYAGQLVADGRLPYEGLVNRAGPLAHWAPGVGSLVARALGADELLGARVLFMLFSVAAVVATYLLARDLFGSRLAGLVAASTMLAFRFFTIYATSGPREKTLVVLLMLLAWLAAYRRSWALAGVLAALATLTWQIAFVWLGPSILLAALLADGRRWRAVAGYVLGGLGTLAACVLVFAVPGRLDLLVDGVWTVNREYVAPRVGTGREPDFWQVSERVYGASAWLFALGLAATLLVALVALVRRDFPDEGRGRTGTLMVAVGSLCGGAWTAVVFDGNADTLPLLPGAAVMLGGVVVLLRRWWNPAGVAVATALLLVCGVLVARLLVEDQARTLTRQRAEVAAVFDHLPPDASLLVAGAPEASVLADKRNASRFQRFSRGTWAYLGDAFPGGHRAYLDWIDDSGATVLAVRHGFVHRQIRAHGLENYEEVGPGSSWTWYLDTTATTARTRDRIRGALAAWRHERRRLRQERPAVEGSPP